MNTPAANRARAARMRLGEHKQGGGHNRGGTKASQRTEAQRQLFGEGRPVSPATSAHQHEPRQVLQETYRCDCGQWFQRKPGRGLVMVSRVSGQ